MRLLIAPDKFKACLPAASVAAHIAETVRGAMPHATIDLCPLSDGGEGFVDALVAATAGTRCVTSVQGPLSDQRVDAAWGWLGGESAPQRTAVIEMSAASGFALVPPGLRDPMHTTTFGTGELLLAAARGGATRILLGIGGSATVDAGLGCCQAVGHTVLRKDGEPVDAREPLFGRDLADIYMIKRGRGSPLDRIPITVACDVTNPLTGPHGAAHVFGPQKGATPEQVAWFDREHAALAARCHAEAEAMSPGAGAAGGLGWALRSFFSATLTPGFSLVATATGLRERVAAADLVLTAEGAFDASSLSGKTPAGVARLCKELGKPCLLLAGRVSHDPASLFAAHTQVTPDGTPISDAVARAGELIRLATTRLLAPYTRV